MDLDEELSHFGLMDLALTTWNGTLKLGHVLGLKEHQIALRVILSLQGRLSSPSV